MQATAKEQGIRFQRVWAMPSADTFDIPAIRAIVKKYLAGATVSIDPFARNKRWATYTNDLNPDTAAEYHLDALDFLRMLHAQQVKAEVVLFDPPYSLRQCVEVYKSVGKPVTQRDTQIFGRWTEHKRIISEMVTDSGIVISCGWNSRGMGLQNGFDIEEILLVCHGGAHNDTICTVEKNSSTRKSRYFE